jgi:methionyl-tRNA formyltransferase
MNFALIGRSELSYDTATLLIENGFTLKLVVTAKEAPEYKYTSDDFKKLAAKYNADFFHSPKITAAEIKDIVLREEVELAVSVNYSGIIAEDIINLFPLGVLNAHSGDLPRYRGNACQAWAIINGEDKIGLSIHKMIGGELDSGDILERKFFPVTIDTRVGEAFEWMTKEIPVMMLSSIKKLQQDNNYVLEVQSKNPTDALRTYPRIPADGKIDWKESALTILRLINASSEPYHGAFCNYNGKEVKIWRAALFNDEERYLAVPGQISEIGDDGSVIVITGKGKLKLLEAEVDAIRKSANQIFTAFRKRLQ